MQAARGRLLQPADDHRYGVPAAVVSEGFWQEHFTGSPLGRPLTIDGRSYEVVGTLPKSFAFLRDNRTAVWLPFAHTDAKSAA